MAQFKLVNSVYFGDKLIQAGEVVELDEKNPKVQGYLDRGSLVAYDASEETRVDVKTDAPVPPVITADPTPEQIAEDLKSAGA